VDGAPVVPSRAFLNAGMEPEVIKPRLAIVA
jgi:hypothetical protein